MNEYKLIERHSVSSEAEAQFYGSALEVLRRCAI